MRRFTKWSLRRWIMPMRLASATAALSFNLVRFLRLFDPS